LHVKLVCRQDLHEVGFSSPQAAARRLFLNADRGVKSFFSSSRHAAEVAEVHVGVTLSQPRLVFLERTSNCQCNRFSMTQWLRTAVRSDALRAAAQNRNTALRSSPCRAIAYVIAIPMAASRGQRLAVGQLVEPHTKYSRLSFRRAPCRCVVTLTLDVGESFSCASQKRRDPSCRR